MDGYLDYLHVKEIQKDRLAAVRAGDRGRNEAKAPGRLFRVLLTALHIGKRP